MRAGDDGGGDDIDHSDYDEGDTDGTSEDEHVDRDDSRGVNDKDDDRICHHSAQSRQQTCLQ